MGGRAAPWALWALAVVAVPCALVLAVVGIDVLRAPGELSDDDRQFHTAPARDPELWEIGFLPDDGTEKLLGLEDDVAFRRVAAAYLDVEPGEVDWVDVPELESLRESTQEELDRRSREEPDPVRRARFLTLYGVLRLDARPTDEAGREEMARDAATAFRTALDLDPANVDAMTNLEALLDAHGELLQG